MKRPAVVRFVLAFGIAIGMSAHAQHAPAQPAASPDEQQKSAELAQLYQRWQRTQDSEHKITLAEQALALEPALTLWPLEASRERIEGQLQLSLGYAYQTLKTVRAAS